MLTPVTGLYGSGANHQSLYGSPGAYGGASLKSVSDAGEYGYAMINGLDSYDEDSPHDVPNFRDYDDELAGYSYAKQRSKSAAAAPKSTRGSSSATDKVHSKPSSSYSTGPAKDLRRRKSAVAKGLRRAADDYYDNADNRQSDDKEQVDHEQGKALRRVRRQVYYSSGYNGQQNCQGFPLEINVRSRIKMDRLFPIHGNSQVKKCVRFE